MSTIEEAREQAREALAQWDAPGGNHSGQVIGFLASALRALLDATEPPKPAEDEREALIESIRFGQEAIDDAYPTSDYSAHTYRLDRAIDALRRSTGPRPITDEMVEAGVNAAWNKRTVGIGGQVVYGPSPEMYRIVRAALEAAEEARR